MKITIVQGGFLPVPPLLGGAVEKVWFALGQEFARRGHEVTHISRLYDELPARETLLGVQHVRIVGFDAPSSRPLLWLKDLFYAIRARRVLPRADILVTNSIWLPTLVRGKDHGALYVHLGRYPKGQTRLYHHAARLQTVSRAVADAIRRQDPKSSARVCVIPYPLPQAVEPIDVARTWAARRKEILYLGRVHPEKGLHELVSAFRLLAESGLDGWRLVIVGPWEPGEGGGGQRYYDALRAKSKPVADRIDFIGPVFDQDSIAAYYKRARLFVYPSLAERGEAFPVAPLEAMACGCPPLVSGLSCFEDYIENGCSGFTFDHRSASVADALYRRMKEVIADDANLMSVAVRAHRVAQGYERSAIAEMYLQDFASIARGDGAAQERNSIQ